MSAATTGAKRRWLISAAGAAILICGLVVLFRSPRIPVTVVPQAPPKPPIMVNPGRADELAMRDLAPLFLPTPYNAKPANLQLSEPGAAYFERDPGAHEVFDLDNPSLHLPAAVRAPANPVEALADVPPPLAKGIGRTDLALRPLPPNGGHVDVFAGDNRDSVLEVALGVDAKPPLAGRGTLGWKPLEFVAAVDASGLVGPLLLTNGSGVEEVDNHFRNYLARTFRIGDRLPPGFYRIVVGP